MKKSTHILQKVAKPLLGKGYIDKHAPFLITLYQKWYAYSQKEYTKTVEIPLGLQLTVFAKDIGVGLPLLVHNEYEPTTTKLFLDSLNEGDTVFDVGANVGYFTLLAASKVGKKGKIIAFEPDPENAALLRKNIEDNNLENVVVEETAISDKIGTISFNFQQANKGESSVGTHKHSNWHVPTTTLDHYITEHAIKSVSVIKMDIEGAEVMALNGATITLSHMKSLKLFIEYNPASIKHFHHDPNEMLRLIEKNGLKLTSIIDDRNNKILPFTEKHLTAVLSQKTYCNLYCTTV